MQAHTFPADPFMGPFQAWAGAFGLSPMVFVLIFAIIGLWSLALKGFALWHAARGGQKPWFVALLIVNTFGILEIVYLLFFRGDKTAVTTKEEA